MSNPPSMFESSGPPADGTNDPRRTTILVVEDEPRSQRIIQRLLLQRGHAVDVAGTAEEALELIELNDYDVTLVDYQLPDLMGHELVEQARVIEPLMQFVGISGYGNPEVARNLMSAGAIDFFDKHNLADNRFHDVVERAISERTWRDEDAHRRRRVDKASRGGAFAGLYGNSPSMLSVKDDIRMVSPRTGVPVLILGPSGAGKERVANAIHRASGVKGRFVACNVAEIPETLFEGELFGHKRGAYTGAERTTPGLFEQANDGTLFLDEIGLLPMTQQGKLLRVLNEKQFRMVGDTMPKRFTGRLVCATNENLKELVREGKFREDLLFRINMCVIDLPDLNSRIEDIPHLAYYFIEQLNIEWKLVPPISTVEPEVWRALQGHDWRANNVRELRNVITQAAMRAADEASLNPRRAKTVAIRHAHLPSHLRDAAPALTHAQPVDSTSPAPSNGGFAFPSDLFSLSRKNAKDVVIREFESRYVQFLLEQHDYNVTHAARAADMQRPNFKRLMNRLDIKIPRGQH